MAIGWSDSVEWRIRGRAAVCSRLGTEFAEGDWVYTLLFRDGGEFRREDLCEEAWRQVNEGGGGGTFCFWRSRYQPPPPAAPEPLPGGSAEELLRHLLDENVAGTNNARYVLAVMLERRRILRQVEAREVEEGRLLVYEHAQTGEAFLIPDPALRLNELERVQAEVIELLERGVPAAGGGDPPGSIGGEGDTLDPVAPGAVDGAERADGEQGDEGEQG